MLSQKPYINQLEKLDGIRRYVSDFLFYLKDNIYITENDIETYGLDAYKNIFTKAGYKIETGVYELYHICETDNIELFESNISEYLIKSSSITSLYFFSKGNWYSKFGYDDLAVANYKLALQKNKRYVPAMEALLRMFVSGKQR